MLGCRITDTGTTLGGSEGYERKFIKNSTSQSLYIPVNHYINLHYMKRKFSSLNYTNKVGISTTNSKTLYVKSLLSFKQKDSRQLQIYTAHVVATEDENQLPY